MLSSASGKIRAFSIVPPAPLPFGAERLRKQLIHGASAAMPHLAAKPNQLGTGLQAMLTRAHPNVVVVAWAAKLSRIAWAVLRHEKDFDRQASAGARSRLIVREQRAP